MYSGPLLKSGNLRDYMALGEIGQPVYAAADQIRTAVLHQIGKDAADLFAVPKFDAVGRNIDWYAPVDGDIVPWDAASPEERETARQKILDINTRIESHAGRIVADPQSNDQLVFGRLLALCNHIPDTSHIFIIKGQPVLTFWGFVPAGADPSRHKLADLVKQEPVVKTAAAAPIAPAAAAGAGGAVLASVPIAAGSGFWRWLWWLLSLLLLLLILLIALRSCSVVDAPVPYVTDKGIVWPGETPPDQTIVTGPDGTVTGTVDGTTNGTVVVPNGTVDPNAPADGKLPGTVPEDQGAKDKAEKPNADQTTPPDAQTPDEQKADQQKQDEQKADQQKQDEQKAGEKNPQDANAPDAKQPDQKTGETPPGADQQAGAQPPIKPIELPADGGNANGPADFMQGQWRSQTGLRASGSNAPATIGYQFDKQGKGTTTLHLGNGVTCSGASAATTQNGKLSIQDQGGLQCSDGSQFQGSTVECSKGADGKTHCVGRYPNGQQYDILLGQ
jgi:outer membrane biosynthesis protein TonB